VSYALVTYALVIVGVAGYASWLASTARRLAGEVRARAGTNRG
jgi:hypothetical protein